MDVKDMKLKVRLYVHGEDCKFMGIGVLWLLRALKEYGSLRAAAASLGISYSKAFAMIRNLEEALEMPVLERRKGGSDRSGSSLTPFALRYIDLYGEFQDKCDALLKKPFEDFTSALETLTLEHRGN